MEKAPLAAVMIVNAMRAVTDLAAEDRRSQDSTFRELVVEAVRSVVGDRVRTNEEVKGDSGRAYRPSTLVLDERKSKAIAIIEPLPNRAAVSRCFTEFYDISTARPDLVLASVFDENSDIKPQDAALLANVTRSYFSLSAAGTALPSLLLH
jgi:hypothetical protein